jgi:hypothetical protein
MFSVRADVEKNRLYITLAGHLDEVEQREAVASVLSEAGKLMPGFDLLSDIASLRPTDEAGLKQLVRVQEFLRDHGLRRAIRVTGIVLSEIQMERTGREVGYVSLTAGSIEEAERILDANASRKER